jgi:hypothetical protein
MSYHSKPHNHRTHYHHYPGVKISVGNPLVGRTPPENINITDLRHITILQASIPVSAGN